MAKLKRESILQTYPKIEELVGSSIYVAVIVQTENGIFILYFFNSVFGCEQFKLFAQY